VAFVLSPPLMEDTEASRAAKDLFRECAHPTIVVAMVARRAPVTDDRLGGGADGRQLETLHPGSAGPSRINIGARDLVSMKHRSRAEFGGVLNRKHVSFQKYPTNRGC
jgi:hypothetical protein